MNQLDDTVKDRLFICRNPSLIFVHIPIAEYDYDRLNTWPGCTLPFTQGCQDRAQPYHYDYDPGWMCDYKMKGLIMIINITSKSNYNPNS